MKKPSDFCIWPWGSVSQSFRAEHVALNIMNILTRRGDEWRPLTPGEYKEERLKDGDFSEPELDYLDQLDDYCESSETAKLFSPAWGEVRDKMNYEQAKQLTGRQINDVMSYRYMDLRGAYSDSHEAQTAGFAPCRHKCAHRGFVYTAVKSSVRLNHAYYSLWARKEKVTCFQ